MWQGLEEEEEGELGSVGRGRGTRGKGKGGKRFPVFLPFWNE